MTLYFLPCLSPTPSLPPGSSSNVPAFSAPCLSTHGCWNSACNCPSQPSPPGSLPDWTHLLQEVFPDHSMKTALQAPTLLALSLLFPVFNFLLCNYYYLNLHRVFIIITFYYLSAPLKCELHERRGFLS